MSYAITAVGPTIASSDLPVDHTIVHISRNIDGKTALFASTYFCIAFPRDFSQLDNDFPEHLLNRFIPRGVKCPFSISEKSYVLLDSYRGQSSVFSFSSISGEFYAPLDSYLWTVLESDFTQNKFVLKYLLCYDLISVSYVMTATFVLRRLFSVSQLCQALIIVKVVTSFAARDPTFRS